MRLIDCNPVKMNIIPKMGSEHTLWLHSVIHRVLPRGPFSHGGTFFSHKYPSTRLESTWERSCLKMFLPKTTWMLKDNEVPEKLKANQDCT